MSNLITIKTYNNRIEAEADSSLLKNYNIKSVVSADDCGGVRPHMTFTGGVQLLINEKNRKKAAKILKIND
ncbi:hypothetical protein KAS41_00095 [Candidatus Parcubacteria bacterium]|nr:hypothetical protein [Candidatus Parcubacteria bacterium]